MMTLLSILGTQIFIPSPKGRNLILKNNQAANDEKRFDLYISD